MNIKEQHVVTGMSKDLSVNQFKPEFVYDAQNIRITSRNGGNTLLSVTNEKGTAMVGMTGTSIEGTPIGHAVFNNTIILFTHEQVDRIYRIDIEDSISISKLIFAGNLNFDENHPIETLYIYENEDIQKVYWLDGINQPRVLDVNSNVQNNPDKYNFVREVSLEHQLNVEKVNSGGEFPIGTVQYAFSYFNKFGQETNIVETTPMYYLSPKDRGLNADEMSNCSFKLTFTKLDSNFEYIRVYSIVRSVANSTPVARIVGDYKTSPINVENIVDYGDEEEVIRQTTSTSGTLYFLNRSAGTITRMIAGETYPTMSNQMLNYVLDFVEYKWYYSPNNGPFIYQDRYATTLSLIATGILVKGSFTSEYTAETLEDVLTNDDGTVVVIDNGTGGSSIDAQLLHFIGGELFTAQTFTQKDNTLFLGNIELKRRNIGDLPYSDTLNSIRAAVADDGLNNLSQINVGIDQITPKKGFELSGINFYSYNINNDRPSTLVKRFKYGENYRLGFIAQYKTGQWSEAVWIKDADNLIKPRLTYVVDQNSNSDAPSTGGWQYVLDTNIVNALIDNDYVRVAPVVVYPQLSDRRVICQGILSPTVFNVKDRYQNAPFVQSSWFFRFKNETYLTSISGHYNAIVYNNLNMKPAEIQSHYVLDMSAEGLYAPNEEDVSKYDYVSKYGDFFYVDNSIVTFHSPDIECSDELLQYDFTGIKMRIVGSTRITDSRTQSQDSPVRESKFVVTETSGADKDYGKFYDVHEQSAYLLFNGYRNRVVPSYVDNFLNVTANGNDKDLLEPVDKNKLYGWYVYPWHRSGSLNNQVKLPQSLTSINYKPTAKLQYKKESWILYGKTSYDNITNSVAGSDLNSNPQGIEISTPTLFNYDQMQAVRIPAPLNSGLGSLVYYGNVDKVLVSSTAYPILWGWTSTRSDLEDKSVISKINELFNDSTGSNVPTAPVPFVPTVNFSTGAMSNDPVNMRYKSSPHLVISFGYTAENSQTVLPTSNPYSFTSSDDAPFWNSNINSLSANSINVVDTDSNTALYIADLYRTFNSIEMKSRFGGRSDKAFTQNEWVMCGEPVNLAEDTQATIKFVEGDTYLGRYDCLKTYPYTQEDENSIIEIFSTEVESRVNLDERYDRNRGLQDNTYISPVNFNLFNHLSYEQDRNFFNYHGIEYDRYKSLKYPNMVTWSLEKTLGEDVDTWTSINLTSTLSLNGEYGEITSLNTHNDNIIAFQEEGISNILFNSRVQIPVSDGIPIEITNGYKVEGSKYISNKIGCKNKWSIVETSFGIYFIDDNTNTIHLLSGNSIDNLSDRLGFKSFMDKNNHNEPWTLAFNNERTFFDRVNKDVYFTYADKSLVYSEVLGQFTSFMDYGSTPIMTNVGDRFFAFRMLSQDTADVGFWEFWKGDYNYFFGKYKPYSLTFISNNGLDDKIFNNLEWRNNVYNGTEFKALETFDTLKVWNEYQDTGNVSLVYNVATPSNLKKKFNVWRTQIPRDNIPQRKLNRIRNPWTYIKLSKETPNTRKMQFFDMSVDYFV